MRKYLYLSFAISLIVLGVLHQTRSAAQPKVRNLSVADDRRFVARASRDRVPSSTTIPPPTTSPHPPTTTPLRPRLSSPPAPPDFDLMLLCIRGPWHGNSQESNGNYADTPDGFYKGAYQFSQDTWNGTAKAIGRTDLINVNPAYTDKNTQDTMALALYHRNETKPTTQWPKRDECFNFPLAA